MEWEGTAEADAEEREKAHADIMSRKRIISEEMERVEKWIYFTVDDFFEQQKIQ